MFSISSTTSSYYACARKISSIYISFWCEYLNGLCVKTLNPEHGKIWSTERSYTGARRNRTQGHKECYNVGSGLGFNLCVAPSS